MSHPSPDPLHAALLQQAVAHHRAGRFAAAQGLYRQLLARDPDNADIRHNLGAALAQQGKLSEAVPHLLAALEKRPDQPRYWNVASQVLRAMGDREGLEALYRKMVALQPDSAAAHFNLGNVLKELGRLNEAEAEWGAALKHKPDFAQAHNNLGNLAKLRGDLAAAATHYRAATKASPDLAQAHFNFGNVLEQTGKLSEAEASYRRVLSLEPDHPDAGRYLGGVLCELGRTGTALEIFMAHAHRRYDAGPSSGPAPAHKVRHDSEQRAWLKDESLDIEKLRIEGGERLAGAAVNPKSDAPAIMAAWKTGAPQLVVIDDLLTAPALEAMRRYCLGSTIWRQSFPDGYVGALPEHGFAAPLLAQIGEELASVYPAIFAGHPLLQLWAFKYDSDLKGIKLHADFAAVNVNFWITPDDANLDPEHGGLVVWDKAAPLEWDFKKYNNDEPAMRDFLRTSGAQAITVPYRANRAVVFDSDLFHETDVIRFRQGYENRRINVTMLYGWRMSKRTAGG
ncbi:MAG TPA: tetratricopeptide repeat protein [Rhizomicrobium sp.]|nr:tetratricopeptide repeat protein [Rhizomicrobium sp.]